MNVYSMDSLNLHGLHYRPINIMLLTVWSH